MLLTKNTLHKVSPIFLVVFLLFSCSKDADLLSEYVIADKTDLESIALLVDDSFFISNGQQSILLDVLNNDTFESGTQVNIVSTSLPKNGNVIINDNNTLTYTPQIATPTPVETTPVEATPVEATPVEDTFTYTTEVITSEAEVQRQQATVTISTSDMGELKAFPGAEGFGKNATGGRGGFVVEVTNLNDDGPGSLRYALQSVKGKRTVVFKVGGAIKLNYPLTIDEGYGDVTIAGQTAPGDGISIEGASLWISDSNVILRYLRIRPGYDWNFISGTQNDDALRIISWDQEVNNIIVDHCSISWGKDENIEISTNGGAGVKNVTIQNSIISENIESGYGFIIFQNSNNISIYKNLFAHNFGRNIESTTPNNSFEMINNIIYGYVHGTRLAYQNKMNLLGNSYISRPGLDIAYENVRLEVGSSGTGIEKTEAFIQDNISNGGSITISNGGVTNLMPYLKSGRVINSNTDYISPTELETDILGTVGASISRDAVDSRLVNDVKNRTGKIIKNENEVGGFPSTNGGTAYEDSDKDGISDEWESSNALNPNDAEDGKANAGNGYTNLEVFLQWLIFN